VLRRIAGLLVGAFLVSACGVNGVSETAPLSAGEAQPSYSAGETITAAKIAETGIMLEPDGLGIVRFGDPADKAVEALVDALGPATLDESFTGPWPSSGVTTGRSDQGCTEATGYKCVDYLRRVAWERWGLAVVFSDVRGYSRSLSPLVTDPHLVVWEHWVPEGGRGFTLASGVGPGSTVGELRGHYEARQLGDMAIGCPGGGVDTTGLNLDNGDVYVLPGNDTTSSTPLDASVEISFMWAGFHKECRFPHPFDGPRAGSLEAIGSVVSPACGYLADAWVEMAMHQARIQVPNQDETRPPEPSVIGRLVGLCPSPAEHTIGRICEQFTEATDPAAIAYRFEIYGDEYGKKQTDYHWRHATWTAAWYLATQNADSSPDAVDRWLDDTCASPAPTTTTQPSTTTQPRDPAAFTVDPRSMVEPPAQPGSRGALGSGCTPGSSQLPDGIWVGWVGDATQVSVEFDLACMHPTPEEPSISNHSSQFRSVPVDPAAVVYPVLTDGLIGEPISYDTWRTGPPGSFCDSVLITPSLPSGCPVWLYVNLGAITEIVEFWLP